MKTKPFDLQAVHNGEKIYYKNSQNGEYYRFTDLTFSAKNSSGSAEYIVGYYIGRAGVPVPVVVPLHDPRPLCHEVRIKIYYTQLYRASGGTVSSVTEDSVEKIEEFHKRFGSVPIGEVIETEVLL